MEIATLNSNFQADRLIENYESAIWTERYVTSGDFEIKGSNIGELMDLMPLESYICLEESTVPMVVEVYKVEKKKNSAPTLTVSGRSFESVLERRAAVKTMLADGSVRAAWLEAAQSSSDAAYNAMRAVLGDLPRYQNGVATLPLKSPAVSPDDAIPEIDLVLPADYQISEWSPTVAYYHGNLVGYGTGVYEASMLPFNMNKNPSTETTFWTLVATVAGGTDWGVPATFEVPAKDLYSSVLDLITTNHHGIKATRPNSGGSKIGIEIYNGADLTNDVIFDAQFDQIDDATYLLSKQGQADVAYVYGPNGGSMVGRSTGATYLGLDRRVLLLDLVSDSSVSTPESRNSRGLIEIYKNNPTALFDGEIAAQVAAGYNSSYFLGDIITLAGEYGLSDIVRVSEFIRSSDTSGTKAYPTFERVEL